MTRLLYIAFLVPLLAISQQTVEICGDTKTFNYSVQSDIASSTEWYVNGTYYYGEDISITWSYPGTYTLIATATADGCSSTPQTYTVTVTECDPLLYFVPNTFTPNGDEYNTQWGPVFYGPYDAMDFNLIVTNRWGNLIWQSFDATAKWDGTYNNMLVNDGTYIWHMNFGVLNSDKRVIMHGHVTILR